MSVSKNCFSACNSKTERRMENLSTDSESEHFKLENMVVTVISNTNFEKHFLSSITDLRPYPNTVDIFTILPSSSR